MAGISFLDLMFAEALASGLAREAARAEKPPDNFFLIPPDPRAWRQIQEASKKENMVIAIEITENSSMNCKRMQQVFMDLAREIEGIPFLRVQVGPGGTYEELRKDVGGVQFVPTFLIMWFGDSKTFRVKYEGTDEIRQAISTGRMKLAIKEFIQRRQKLRLAEQMAEELAGHVKSELDEREKRLRREYEERLHRQIAEKEEAQQREEEERRKRQEEEEKILEEKRRRTNEIRRESRPQYLQELLQMNLDSAPIRDIKAIMIKLGISPHDCFERSDLKKKLIASVPELRIQIERRASAASTASVESDLGSSFGSGSMRSESINSMNNLDDPLGAGSGLQIQELQDRAKKAEREVDKVKQERKQLEDELQTLRHQLKTKEVALKGLDSDLKKMTTRANEAESQALDLKSKISKMTPSTAAAPVPQRRPVPKPRTISGGDPARLREVETQLLETRMLYTTNIEDYNVIGLIHDSGEEGIVLRAQCIKKGIPNPERVYAMKVLTNYFQMQTATQARVQFQNEYQVLCQIPPHDNIIHMFAFFYDRANPDISPHFKRVGRNMRTMSLFLLMDEHPMSMKEQLGILVENQGPKPDKVLQWFHDLLKGLAFLHSHNILHRDLKLDNLLVGSSGRVVISDFGKAIILDDSLKTPHPYGYDIGGNRAHLSPEVLNSKPGPRSSISYTKQAVWAAGVLGYEFAGHKNPFESGTIDSRGYNVDELPPLKYTYCKNSKFCQPLHADFTALVKEMLQMEVYDRLTLQSCLKSVSKLCEDI